MNYLGTEGESRVAVYWAKDKASWDLRHMVDKFAGLPVYVTIDVDVFDSSVMPATGTPEPGGLIWGEVLKVVDAFVKACDVVWLDVVELAPSSGLHSCDFLVAKLVRSILCRAYSKRRVL